MKVEKKLFFPSLIILTAIIVAISTNLSFLQKSIGAIYDGCISTFGWLFIFADICCLVFSLWLMFGRYKDVRLGGEDCKPNFSTLSWAGMMFTTSCGAWLIVYGFLEPIYCVSQDAILDGGSAAKAYELGQTYAHFHWGPNAWAIYVPISIAIGYALYNRKGKAATVSAGISSVTPKKWGKGVGVLVDIIAICGAVVAPVISIGTGMPLLTALVQKIFNVPDAQRTMIQIVILGIWVAIFGTSVYLGLNKGIKRLSNLNITIAFIFMLAFGVIVGLIHVFSSEINTTGLLAQNFIRLNTYTDPYGSGGFVRGWTFSYWACYFVYMPLMGVFNAKISKGRTLRQIAFGQLILCSLGCWVAMGTFGNFAVKQQMNGVVDVSSYLSNGDEAGAIIALLESLPAAKVFMVILLAIAFIFLATTMDSSAFAAAEMTSRQTGADELAPRWLRVLWATVAAVIAFVVVQVGGAKAVRSVCYIAGLPLALIAFVIIYSVFRMLRKDFSRKSVTPFMPDYDLGEEKGKEEGEKEEEEE
jgi:BCCT family betaine/carnitine transporter